MDIDPARERGRELSRRLLRLHKILLDREREAWEARHGAVPAGELFQRLLTDPEFAWLRALSRMIAGLDDLLEAEGPLERAHLARLFEDAYRLLKADADIEFQRRYHAALQASPDVVIAHAEVSRLLERRENL